MNERESRGKHVMRTNFILLAQQHHLRAGCSVSHARCKKCAIRPDDASFALREALIIYDSISPAWRHRWISVPMDADGNTGLFYNASLMRPRALMIVMQPHTSRYATGGMF